MRVVVRGDAGFCRDELMAWCEAAEGVDYVFGLAQNARLKRALAQPGAGQRAGVAAVPRFPLSDAGELEPQAAGGGPGGGARGQPALRGDQPGAGADRDPAAVRAAVLRARGHGEPHQGAAAGPVRGPDFGGDAAGEPVATVLGPVRGGAAGGVATTRAGGDGAGAAAESGRGGAVAGGDAGIACGPAVVFQFVSVDFTKLFHELVRSLFELVHYCRRELGPGKGPVEPYVSVKLATVTLSCSSALIHRIPRPCIGII